MFGGRGGATEPAALGSAAAAAAAVWGCAARPGQRRRKQQNRLGWEGQRGEQARVWARARPGFWMGLPTHPNGGGGAAGWGRQAEASRALLLAVLDPGLGSKQQARGEGVSGASGLGGWGRRGRACGACPAPQLPSCPASRLKKGEGAQHQEGGSRGEKGAGNEGTAAMQGGGRGRNATGCDGCWPWSAAGGAEQLLLAPPSLLCPHPP